MSEPHIVTALQRKRDDIESAIAIYEKKIEEARRDLAAVVATLRLFEIGDGNAPLQFPAYADIGRLWKRGEMVKVCRQALEMEGPLDTRELAVRVIRAKGLDDGDKVLRQSVAFRIVQALRMAMKRGAIGELGKRKGVRVWKT
jgi:hypothetical protein